MDSVRIKIRQIVLDRAEGPTVECGPKPPVSTFAEANRLLSRMRTTAPKKGSGYDKTDFRLEFEDGEVYEGRMDLQQDVYEYLEDHVKKFCLFYSGRATIKDLPSHITPQKYNVILSRHTKADLTSMGKFLDLYQIGD